jgi:starch synthase (maltosyl-transferring)
VTIEAVDPEIDGGRFAAKRGVGETFTVEVDVFTDGHDIVSGVLLYRRRSQRKWRECPLTPIVNDRYTGHFVPDEVGPYIYTVQAWIDHYATWLHDLRKRVGANQDLGVPLAIGAELVEDAGKRAKGDHRRELKYFAKSLVSDDLEQEARAEIAEADELVRLMSIYHDRGSATTYHKELNLWADRPRAICSAWYEMFPRSSWDGSGKPATLRDCEKRLDYIAGLGFDVLYLPPIHPIGRTFRKGKNNSLVAQEGDPGSPWAIGAKEGGHDAIHPDLGTEADFKRLVKKAADRGIDVALDIALQCSPEHPYVQEHPKWFRWRPDGTIQYAENPPKKYQDIYPIEFESSDWRDLWEELRRVFQHWIDLGVHIFRVDNPHTKPFRFWEWLIDSIHEKHPDVIFLAEAFTRPKVMQHLAKLGFTQSYTYFAWRNAKWELTEYLNELTQS